MFVCRLFHQDSPFEQLEARVVGPGPMTIGRAPSADWMIGHYDGTLSRIHCMLEVLGGRLMLIDQSTNGTFIDGADRAPTNASVELLARQSISLGAMNILIEQSDATGGEANATHSLARPPVSVAEDWLEEDPAPPSSPHRDASLLEAFFEGAKLDPSSLASEDPAELMRRAGAIYQQTILALAALMADRARLKSEHSLERTTIGAAENNPFKWSPSRRLAQDLLRARQAGFLGDCDAVRASFEDVSRHMAGVCQGASAVAATVVQTLDPKAIEAEAKAQPGLLRSHASACWDVFQRRYEALADPGEQAPLKRAFADAYEQTTDPASRAC